MRDIQYLSIFGEVDAAAAQAMVSEGLAMWITADTIPEGVLYNDSGDRACFAIAIHRSQMRAFMARIAKAKKGANRENHHFCYARRAAAVAQPYLSG